jgi:hypothetical protein
VEIWLSPKLPALGEDSVSGSVCNIIDTLVEFGLALPSNVDKNKRATIMIYTTWNIWNERNHMRTFYGKSSTPCRVLQLIKEEMASTP